MIGIGALVILAGLTVTTVLSTSFNQVVQFHKQTKVINNWDTTVLAAANLVARESNAWMQELRDSYNESLELYTPGEPFNDPNINERINMTIRYLNKIENIPTSNSALNETLHYGLNFHPDASTEVSTDSAKGFVRYSTKLINATYIPTRFNEQDPVYGSTLLKRGRNIRYLTGDRKRDTSQYRRWVRGNHLCLTDRFLRDLMGDENANLMRRAPHMAFGFAIVPDTHGFNTRTNVPNGISTTIIVEFDIADVNDKDGDNDRDEIITIQKEIEKISTAQLSLVPPQS